MTDAGGAPAKRGGEPPPVPHNGDPSGARLGRSFRRLEATASLVLAASGVAIAVALLHREFFPADRAAPYAAAAAPPRFLADWNELLQAGLRIGEPGATVKIIEFADLECPFCRQFHGAVNELRRRFGSRVAHVFVHYPLPMHRFARPAARAAECANDQGRFAEFVNAVFEKQDSLGLKSWVSYAREAGVTDTARFMRCAADTSVVQRVEIGVAAGDRIGIRGTPTVVINGWRFESAPPDSELTRVVSSLLAGRAPFNAGGASGPK